MIDWYGVPGKLKTLTDRLTSARATNLDNLNATITSTAPASTALSVVTWTNALATLLGNTIQTSVMGGLVQEGWLYDVTLLNGTVEDEKYYDVPVSAVVIGKCPIIEFQLRGNIGTNVTPAYGVTCRLTTTTNLRISAGSAGGATTLRGRWRVVELK